MRPAARAYAVGAVGIAAVVAVSAWQIAAVHHREATEKTAARTMLQHKQPCVGAAAMVTAGCDPFTRAGEIVPGPLVASSSTSEAWTTKHDGQACVSGGQTFPLIRCTFGDPHGTADVALVGNSHAADLLPALDTAAKKHHWRVTTYLILGCALADVRQSFPTPQQEDSCSRWGQDAMKAVLAGHFDLVVMSNRPWTKAADQPDLASSLPEYRRGYTAVLRQFQQARLRVLLVRDTPYPGSSVPDCISAHRDDYLACSGRRTAWLTEDPTIPALQSLPDPHMRVADLSRFFCTDRTCPAVIGKVLVYFDGSHVSEEYARTLAPYLAPYVTAALKA